MVRNARALEAVVALYSRLNPKLNFIVAIVCGLMLPSQLSLLSSCLQFLPQLVLVLREDVPCLALSAGCMNTALWELQSRLNVEGMLKSSIVGESCGPGLKLED